MDIIEYISKLDIMTLLVMGLMFWRFNSSLNKKFDKIDNKFDDVTNRFDNKFDDVRSDMKEMRTDMKEMRTDMKELRTSLNRIEGAFYAKECCMLKDERQIKKVE